MPGEEGRFKDLGPRSSIRVRLEKRHGTGLGMSIKPSAEEGVMVDALLPGGIACESDLVKPGDIITRVNDIDISKLPYKSALAILEAIPSGVPVVLLLRTAPGEETFLQTTFTSSGLPCTRRVARATTEENAMSNGHADNGMSHGPHSDGTLENGKQNGNGLQTITTHRNATNGNAIPSVCPMSRQKKYQKLRYLMDDSKVYSDTLHLKATEDTGCDNRKCVGSILDPVPKRAAGSVRSKEELIEQAKNFIDQYYTSIKRLNSPGHVKRLDEVMEAIEATGTYHLTASELTFGAKTAWRNAPRCIGRIQWSKLQVFDARHILTARGMFDAICNHIKYATNKGNIRSAITVFPHRTDGCHDFRVWNGQLLSYAAYQLEDGTIIGDKVNLEFTQLCEKLGWKGKGGMFDVLPLVLQANGEDPEVFDIPADLIVEVKLKHPEYPWFEELGLKWYAMPAVSGMMLDCGGLEFTAVPFNGWYMGTEIGARDLCDIARYDLTKTIAEKMGLNTNLTSNLWKDQAVLVANVAVLHSFQSAKVTITDHHAASESFLKHYDTEMKTRGGCPADWVWVVPPISGSLNSVFHLEMLNYKLKPSYEYQDGPWKTYVWKRKKNSDNAVVKKNSRRHKITFRDLARAVRLTAGLMSSALARRVKCTILYATETGKSEGFAKKLSDLFKHAFDPKVHCMDDYNCLELEHETLVLVVTSTFGNGEPPDNGAEFSRMLYGMVPEGKQKRVSKSTQHHTLKTRQDSLIDKENMSALHDHELDTGPLSNVRFSVFGLGSKAYPNFCAFAKYMDGLLGDLGGERIFAIGEGDELCGQEQSFNAWAQNVFKAACETFCLAEDVNVQRASDSLQSSDRKWQPGRYKLEPIPAGQDQPSLCEGLSKVHNRKVVGSKLMNRKYLQSKDSERQTILVKLDTAHHPEELQYQAGDHVAVYPANRTELVDRVIKRMANAPSPDYVVRLQILLEKKTPLGPMKLWTDDQRLPTMTIKRALTHYLDICSPPSHSLLEQFSTLATDPEEHRQLEGLAKNPGAYEKWKFEMNANIAEVLETYPSVQASPTLLLAELPLLQPRYYSISSAPDLFPGQLHMTIAVVKYTTNNGNVHHGVCSSWLDEVEPGSIVPSSVKFAPSFHLPSDNSVPVIMIGPGTGIAPFRSFWQQRSLQIEAGKKCGPMELYFGCRERKKDNIYARELEEALSGKALSNVHLALSREPGQKKVYVQDLLVSNGEEVVKCIMERHGHIYVCGDVTMAQCVGETLEELLAMHAKMTRSAAAEYVFQMKEENRFHEDIFGVTLKTSEVRQKLFSSSELVLNNVSE